MRDIRKLVIAAGIISILLLLMACSPASEGNLENWERLQEEATATWSAKEATATWSARPTPTSTSAPTATATPMATATFTPTPTATPTPTPTATPKYLLAVTVSPANAGSVQIVPASADNRYNTGTVLVLTANCTYGFASWAGDVPAGASATSNPMTLPMSADRSLVAVCSPASTPTPIPTPTPTAMATPTPTPTPYPSSWGPPSFMLFTGTVKVGGQTPPAGTRLYAKIVGGAVGDVWSPPKGAQVNSDGTYMLTVSAPTLLYGGRTIEFYIGINGVKANQTDTFGRDPFPILNLTFP